tara:strand:+ start:1430 stop:1678 length:249 start_codon:yes stop_codon:yes gene_type:complete
MWGEILSSIGLVIGVGGFYGGMYKWGWETAKKDQEKRILEMIKLLDGENQELINQYEEHLEVIKNHKINWGFKKNELAEKLN